MKRSFPIAAALISLFLMLLVVAIVVRNPTRDESSSSAVSASRPPEIHGLIRASGNPVAGARVRAKGSDISTISDALGRFHLPLDLQSPHRVTAWKEGFLIGGCDADADNLRVDLQPLPGEDSAAYEWVDPRPNPDASMNCANCHAEIYREWSAGGHAHSADGRYFRDLYGDDKSTTHASWNLLSEYPDGAGVCASCHAPTANFNETLDLREVQGIAAQGVHCDYCHKVTDAALGNLSLTHGRHGMQLLRPGHGQFFVGPLDDVDRGEDAYSLLYRQSKYCASCHEGTVFGVHVYSTYSEWLASPAAKKDLQCQSCHMKPTGTMTNIAPGEGGIDRRPETLGNHVFFAGGKEAMLRQCLDLKIEVDRALGNVDVLTRLKATGVGHRVPTGFIDRHLLLVVEAQDTHSRPVRNMTGPKLGPAAGKELEDKAGWLYARLVHLRNIPRPVPFWMADHVVDDTRLAPDESDVLHWVFPKDVETIKVALIYRPFWQETAQSKGWGNLDIVLREETVRVPNRR